ncbi:MAG: hypothetical protein K9M80_09430 [Candidatus Marinimicrobia bacterium]|nr:hypothetical protein [Candidatus Neomarinimicrobiota bacterium]
MKLNQFRLRDEPVKNDEVASKIEILHIDKLPRIIIGIGPCRGATTFTLRLFGASGILPFYQHFKYVLRNLLHNENWTWKIPDTDSIEIFYNKETIGPYTQEECNFEPIVVFEKVIQKALKKQAPYLNQKDIIEETQNIIREKVELLFIMRDPYSTWRSWKKEWVARKGLPAAHMFERFVVSYNQIWHIWQRARELSYPCHVLVRDAYRNIEKTFNDLFLDLELPFPPILYNWSKHIEENGLDIVFPDKTPAIYDTHSFLIKAKTSNHVIYKESPPIDTQDKYNIAINHNNLPDIYQYFLGRHLEMNKIRDRHYLMKDEASF